MTRVFLNLVTTICLVSCSSPSPVIDACTKASESYNQAIQSQEKAVAEAESLAEVEFQTFIKKKPDIDEKYKADEKDFDDCVRNRGKMCISPLGSPDHEKSLAVDAYGSKGLADYSEARNFEDTAQRIVLNNQSCFDPTLVVDIQRARGIPPK